MKQISAHPELLEVWMDGACPICRRSQRWCEDRDPKSNIRFIDFRSSANHDLPVQREQHETSMWVRDPDGTMLEGFAAWRRIMETIPGWNWLARIAAVWPLRWIGPPIYRLVARGRHHFT